MQHFSFSSREREAGQAVLTDDSL